MKIICQCIRPQVTHIQAKEKAGQYYFIKMIFYPLYAQECYQFSDTTAYTSCIMHKKNIGRLTVCIHFSWIDARHKATCVKIARISAMGHRSERNTKAFANTITINHHSKHLSAEHICDRTTISLAAFSLLHDQKHTINATKPKDFILTITFHTNSK